MAKRKLIIYMDIEDDSNTDLFIPDDLRDYIKSRYGPNTFIGSIRNESVTNEREKEMYYERPEPDVCGEPNCEDCKPQPEPKAVFVVKCVGCKRVFALEMTPEQYSLWTGPHYQRPLVQVLFPDYTADQRELLLSQTCGPCYDALFPPEAYEPDEDIWE